MKLIKITSLWLTWFQIRCKWWNVAAHLMLSGSISRKLTTLDLRLLRIMNNKTIEVWAYSHWNRLNKDFNLNKETRPYLRILTDRSLSILVSTLCLVYHKHWKIRILVFIKIGHIIIKVLDHKGNDWCLIDKLLIEPIVPMICKVKDRWLVYLLKWINQNKQTNKMINS